MHGVGLKVRCLTRKAYSRSMGGDLAKRVLFVETCRCNRVVICRKKVPCVAGMRSGSGSSLFIAQGSATRYFSLLVGSLSSTVDLLPTGTGKGSCKHVSRYFTGTCGTGVLLCGTSPRFGPSGECSGGC